MGLPERIKLLVIEFAKKESKIKAVYIGKDPETNCKTIYFLYIPDRKNKPCVMDHELGDRLTELDINLANDHNYNTNVLLWPFPKFEQFDFIKDVVYFKHPKKVNA